MSFKRRCRSKGKQREDGTENEGQGGDGHEEEEDVILECHFLQGVLNEICLDGKGFSRVYALPKLLDDIIL